MADFTMDAVPSYPVASTVQVYPEQAIVNGSGPTSAPVASAVVSATGVLTFSGLAENLSYVAAQLQSGRWVLKHFKVSTPKPTLDETSASVAAINAAYIPRSKRPVHVKDQVGFYGDGTTSDASAFADAYAALPSTGGTIALPVATMVPGTALGFFTKNGVQVIGESPLATVLKQNGSSGYLIDVSISGYQGFKDFTIDGAGATGTACAMRLLGAPRVSVERLRILNFTNNTNQFPMLLSGVEDGQYLTLEFENNSQHLRLIAVSNQNVFADNCKFQTVQWASGVAILIENSEANLFEGYLCQGNKGANTIAVIAAIGGPAGARHNKFINGYHEENGNSQAGSHGFHIVGGDASNKVVSTVIRDCVMFSSAQDNPTSQVYMAYADGTVIDGCYSNLGSPNAAVAEGAGVTNTRLGANSFAGTVAGFAANADTSGATLAALEAEVNELKALLRARGLLAP